MATFVKMKLTRRRAYFWRRSFFDCLRYFSNRFDASIAPLLMIVPRLLSAWLFLVKQASAVFRCILPVKHCKVQVKYELYEKTNE